MSPGTLRTNNLDLVRFVLAATVFLVHCHVLSGEPALAPLSAVLSSDLAVKAFFVVSGMLVTMSYERSTSLRDYVERRARRIYPAYAVVVMIAALGLVAVSSVSPTDYFSSVWWRYVTANLVFANFLQPTLPGVFDTHLVSDVNGALWTLKIEVMFYVAVPLIVVLVRRWGAWPVLAAVYVASVMYAAGMHSAAGRTGVELYDVLARQLPGQLSYFVCGAAVYYAFTSFTGRWTWVALMGAMCFVADRVAGVPGIEPLWVAALVAVTAFAVRVGDFGRRGDLSYGIYVLHFPIVQVLVGLGVFRVSPLGGVAIATVLVIPLALAMWHLVERPWLRRSSHYVTGGLLPHRPR